MRARHDTITVAIVNDYDLIVLAAAQLFDQHPHRCRVVDLAADDLPDRRVDIALFDPYANPDPATAITALITTGRAGKVVVFTWPAQDNRPLTDALDAGASGHIDKTLPAADIVAAIESIHHGQPAQNRPPSSDTDPALSWPGRSHGLTHRESEILTLLVQGETNTSIAAICHLSPNTVKTHIRSIYRKTDVSTRTSAITWAINHGFELPNHPGRNARGSVR